MSDIRFNRWLHQSGTGGVYQDSSGRVGIGTSLPTSALDVQSGTIKIGSNTLSSSGVSTFTTVNATTVNTTTITGVSTAGITTVYISSVNDGPISGARNRIINGAMEIAQRGVSATYAGTSQNQSTYNTIDRFAFASYGTYPAGTYATVEQIADSPVGFSSCLRVTANQTLTVGSSNARGVWITQSIEGSNFVDLWNKPITVSFWVKTSNVGTYSLAFTGTGSTAGYATSYTVNSANTWEYKTVTLTHSTSLYTPDRSNGSALTIVFSLLGDATWIGTATANQWVSANVPYLHGCKNLFDTLNATWQITGVQVEPGTVATPFERRSYGQELVLCQRYYQKTKATFGVAATTSYMNFHAPLLVAMRAVPIVGKTSGSIKFGDMVSASFTSTSTPGVDSTYYLNEVCFSGGIGGFSGLTQYRVYRHEPDDSSPSLLTFSAEL